MENLFSDEKPVDFSSDFDFRNFQFDLVAKFDKKKEIIFDFNGHYKSRKITDVSEDYFLEREILDRIHTFLILEPDKSKVKLFEKVIDGKAKGKLNNVFYRRCTECGQDLEFSFDGKTIKAIRKCKYPQGYPPFSVYIDIPSGLMVFANSFPVKYWDEELHDPYGNHKEMKHYAKQKVIQVYCGNSCPVVHRKGQKFYIGSNGYDDDFKAVDSLPGKEIGSICTDLLWAWSMVDANTAKEMGIKVKVKTDNRDNYFTAKVKKGRYKITQYFYHGRGNVMSDTANLFATIEPE